MTNRNHRRLSTLITITLMACLCGCTLGPRYHAPKAQVPSAPNYKESPVNFKDTEGWKVASPQDAMLKGKWWEIYNQPELNALEEQLNINNQNIKQFFENFMEARALIAEARAQYWPTVGVGASWNRSKVSGTLTNSQQANPGRTSTVLNFPVDIAWTPDFFGKSRSQVRASQYGAQVSAADLENERLVEQAALAQYYFEIRGQDALEKILSDTVASDQKSLELTQSLYETGIDAYISVVEAKATLASAKAQLANLGILRAQYEHAISTLLGRPATDFSLPVKPLLTAPPPIPTGVPSQLLERRPDIAAAERVLAQDNAVIGIGYGAFFPNVTLSATAGLESSTFSKVFTWPSRFWSIGPAISQTVFNGGLYRAELHQYTATYNANLAAYRQTVLTAFQQVEDSLSAVRIASQSIAQQQEAVAAAQQSLDIELNRYQTGIDPYVDVIVAQNTVLNDQQALATQQVNQMVASVNLIVALGGGWDRTQLPTPEQVTHTSAADYKLP